MRPLSARQVVGMGLCWAHGRVFAYDPATVCSMYLLPDGSPAERGDPGARPVFICDPCMEQINLAREESGLPPFRLAREMSGWWDE